MGTRSLDCSSDFPKEIVHNFRKHTLFEHFEQFPLENPLEQSDDRVPLPIDQLARLAFQYPVL